MQTGTASINGRQYDQVIDVDISDGAPPLKLGVNRSDNPYEVADRHGLPMPPLRAEVPACSCCLYLACMKSLRLLASYLWRGLSVLSSHDTQTSMPIF